MKTKLLKKIRKRYNIYKIDKSNNINMNEIYGLILKLYNGHAFVIEDSYDTYKTEFCRTYKEALVKLQNMIRNEYYKKIKNKSIIKKVWWCKNIFK